MLCRMTYIIGSCWISRSVKCNTYYIEYILTYFMGVGMKPPWSVVVMVIKLNLYSHWKKET